MSAASDPCLRSIELQASGQLYLDGLAGVAAAAGAAARALDPPPKVWLAAMKLVTDSATAGDTKLCFWSTARM